MNEKRRVVRAGDSPASSWNIANIITIGRILFAPVFAAAFATRNSWDAFAVGLAASIGAGISMAFSEGLSDTGELTGRGNPLVRGAITGGGTFLGGVFHTLPFLVPGYQTAIAAAIVIVATELLLLGASLLACSKTGDDTTRPGEHAAADAGLRVGGRLGGGRRGPFLRKRRGRRQGNGFGRRHRRQRGGAQQYANQ